MRIMLKYNKIKGYSLNEIPCSHCHLTFSPDIMIKEEIDNKTAFFCCQGCQGVYHLLNSSGLDTFYDKLGTNTLEPASIINDDLAKFDLEGFAKKYIKVDDDGLSEIHLIIEGIHCSACVWLNEKVLHQSDGVIEASINFSNNKAKILWDNDEIKLSEIIQIIRNIGYNAIAYDPKLQEEQAIKIRKNYYSRILVAIFGAMNMMWLAVAHYAGYFTGIEQSFENILNVAQFVLATPVLFYSGWIFFRGAYYGYKNHLVNMDTLVASGALSAYIYSIYAMISKEGEVYFDSVVMIITFILVGKYLEVLSKKSAVDTLDGLMGSTPTEVTVIQDKTKTLVSVENVCVGDIIELKAGEKVVIDGKVLMGEGLFDESSITGENEPIYKKQGDNILSASVCVDALIHYEASKDASHSMLHSIVNLLESSLSKKPRLEQLANQVSGYFSTIILLLAVATFGIWYLYMGDFEMALIVGISVIVIACPCALGLATPMATLVAVSMSAKRGILFKEATFLETMAKSSVLALDKTGTITQGKPSVIKAQIEKDFDPEILYALVSSSTHPISKGIKTYLEKEYKLLQDIRLEEVKNIEAKGIRAFYQKKNIVGGNAVLLNSYGFDVESSSENSLFFFAIDKVLVARFELTDTIKAGAKESINYLQDLGIEVLMLTGDHAESAYKVGKEVGINKENIYAKLLPQDKAKHIQSLQAQGEKVVMVGDGINDAIALASADIAISMGKGADIAIAVSDIVLLDNRFRAIEEAYTLSRRTYKAIKENLGFSLLYNLIAVPMAMLGFITPFIAALSMSLSSLVVVANSLRIKRLQLKDK